MRRTRSRDNKPIVKKVENIDLSDKHFSLRIIAVILLIVIAGGAFALGIRSLVRKQSGWYEVTANPDKLNCADDFSFYYRLGLTEEKPNAEMIKLTLMYSEVTNIAYELFNVYEEFENVHNIYYINHHINEEIQVDEVLYKAFELLNEKHNKTIFMGPIFEHYSGIFVCSYDYETEPFDPIKNELVKTYYKEIIDHLDGIELQLLGNNRIRLAVNDIYLSFAKENGIENYIDFSYLTNAFIIDYITNVFKANGFNHGIISSKDGFVRCFDDSNEDHSFTLLVRQEDQIKNYGTYNYSHDKNIVFLHTYPLNSKDCQHIYLFKDGSTRHLYLSISDGINKACLNELVSYSNNSECSEILIDLLDIYIQDTLEVSKLNSLIEKGIYSIYYDNNGLVCNDSDANFSINE